MTTTVINEETMQKLREKAEELAKKYEAK